MVESRSRAVFAKVVILGDLGAGKSSMITAFCGENKGQASDSVMSSKTINIDGAQVKITLWDTAGQERFGSIGLAFYRSSNSCILAFDTTDKKTFDNLVTWKKNFIDNAAPRDPDAFPFLVVGTKTDLADKRVVSREDAEAWCQKNGGL